MHGSKRLDRLAAPLRPHAAAHRPALVVGDVSEAFWSTDRLVSSWHGRLHHRFARPRAIGANSGGRAAPGESDYFRRPPRARSLWHGGGTDAAGSAKRSRPRGC